MPAFAECDKSRPVALVSGHPDKARQTAQHYGLNPGKIYNYDNFDRIKDDPDVQVVYIILPNHMHAEYTIRAAKAGKHVLCEKPMAVTVEESQRMIDACKEAQRKLMIGYRLRYEPFNQSAIDIARKRKYGPIRSIEADNIQNVEAPNIRLSRATGGGPLGDVGVYCINATRYLTGEEPIEVTAQMHQPSDDPRFEEVAESVVWTQKFASGIIANCSCGFAGHESRRYRVHCASGWFELDPAYPYQGLRMRISDRSGVHEPQLPQVNHFAREIDHFSECVLENKDPWTPGAEGLADMRVIAAIQESIRSGSVAKVGA